jgi:hypothetical protein
VGSAAGVISGLSPGAEKDGKDLWTTYVPDGTTDIIIIPLQVPTPTLVVETKKTTYLFQITETKKTTYLFQIM